MAEIEEVKTDIKECRGEVKSVDHFLFRCPLGLEKHQDLFNLEKKANRCDDLSFALALRFSGFNKTQ